ncbi:MAG: TonB-dependent receptor [Myxococcota bacterium]|nr:TonB-dependent receptor [Myxococcota bacterium]
MKRALAIAGALVISSGVAHAQGVDVRDLPALPPADDEPSSSATVLAATSAEEDVVVGAAKREQSLGNVASAVTVISADRLRRFGYRTIGEAVAAVAGAYLVDNRLSYSVGIRGLQIPGDFNTRILVLVDGASINEAWGAYAGVGFDAIVGIDEIARIEVIRGPVSSVYGTNAFFGIVNIVTRGATETARAWARTGVHSINGITTSAGFAAGDVDRQLRGTFHFMDRFGETTTLDEDPAFELAQDGSRAFAAGVVGAYGGSFAQLRAVRFNRESPFGPYDVNLAGPPYDQVDTQLLVEGGHTRGLSSRLTVAGRGYANLYTFRDISPSYEPVLEAPLESTGAAQTYGAELRGRYELVFPDRLGITAGTEASYNRTASTAFRSDAPDALLADVPLDYSLQAIYAELDGQPTSWFGYTAGLRFDRHSKLEDKLSPRAALFFAKPERYGLKLLYAQGFRNPSAYEGYFEDTSDFVAHPEDLSAEAIRSFEAVAWSRPLPGLATRLSAYYWDARNIIEAGPAPEDSDLLQFQNVTRLVSVGLEAEGSYRNSAGWYVFGGGAYTRVGSEVMGELAYGDVTNAPALSAGLGASTPKLFEIVHVSAEAIYLGTRPTRPDANDQPSADAPAWVGLNLTVYAPQLRGFDVTAGARNLVGTRDLMPAPGDYDRSMPDTRVVPRVPGEGREIYVKVGYSY